MVEVSEVSLRAAEERGQALLENAPRAVSAHYNWETGRLELELANGCSYAFPIAFVQDLEGASDADLVNVEVDGLGFNLHWPTLDVDLYVPALVSGIFGTRVWMTRELARLAGKKTSPAKAAAARANGAKGGRPRKIAKSM